MRWLLIGLVMGVVLMISNGSAITFVEKHFTDYYDIQFSDQYLWFKVTGHSSDRKQEISFTPCVYYNNQKQYLYSLKDYGYLSADGMITKDRDSMKFGLNIMANATIKTLVSKLCFEISGNTSNITAGDGLIRMGDMQIDFDDLKKLGFGIETGERQINITNLAGKTFDLDPSVKFNTNSNQITSVSLSPLGNDSFVVAYCDDTDDDISFKIYNTSGTEIVGETDVDQTAGTCTHYNVGSSVFNSTHFVIGWHDQGSDYVSFAIYNITGSSIVGKTDVDTTSGDSGAVQVSTFNSTAFVIGWYDRGGNNASCKTYNSDGTAISNVLWWSVGTGGFTISVSTFNSSIFVIGFFDVLNSDVSFRVYDYVGTSITSTTDADTSAGTNTRSVDVSAFNSTDFAIAWFDDSEDDITRRFFSYKGTGWGNTLDVDATANASSSTRITTINDTHYVMSWYDDQETDNDLTALINTTNTYEGIAFDVEDWPTTQNTAFKAQDVASREIGSGLGFCNNNWVIAYANSTTQADWRSYYINGSLWDGYCEGGAAPPSDCWTKSDKFLSVPNGCLYNTTWEALT